jgi:hypothetical protein
MPVTVYLRSEGSEIKQAQIATATSVKLGILFDLKVSGEPIQTLECLDVQGRSKAAFKITDVIAYSIS